MESARVIMREYRWLLVALLLVASVTTTITNCGGGGGGSSNGELCQQCGDTDGPCQATALIVPGANEPAPCPTPPVAETCVERNLICRRKADSAQQRCFPANGSGSDVDFSFRCHGDRPGGTGKPEPVTPSPTATPAATKTADVNAICGNGLIEGTEVCDGLNLDENTCVNFCADDTGILSCSSCQFNFAACTGGNCS